MNRFPFILVLFLSLTCCADEPAARQVTATVVLCGADTDADVELLFKALKKVDGVTATTSEIKKGFRRFNNRFTTPIEVRIPLVPGGVDSNVGALAAGVQNVKTSHPETHAPGVNLVLFTDEQMNENSISALRSALSSVNGVKVSQPGGLGGNLAEGWCWIRLEKAGGAMLNEILEKAQKSGTQFRLVKSAVEE